MLPFPDFGSPFIVETDASSVALRAVLAQKKKDGKIHRVRHGSRAMNSEEGNYSATERTTLAVIIALSKFKLYLLSTEPFKLIAGHHGLSYSFKKNDINGRIAHWMDLLAEYEFELVHRPPTKSHVQSRLVSRLTLDTMKKT